MSQTWSVPGWVVLATLGAVLLVVVVLVAALLRSHRRQVSVREAARAEVAALAARLEAVERSASAPAPARTDETEYVVTMLGRDEEARLEAEPVPVVPGPLFADLVLREGVVQAASLAAGLRRALSPEVRHRIRFEMRREVKRARKQRRADLREAKRQYDASRRAVA